MNLSERASAFFIENLIIKPNDKKTNNYIASDIVCNNENDCYSSLTSSCSSISSLDSNSPISLLTKSVLCKNDENDHINKTNEEETKDKNYPNSSLLFSPAPSNSSSYGEFSSNSSSYMISSEMKGWICNKDNTLDNSSNCSSNSSNHEDTNISASKKLRKSRKKLKAKAAKRKTIKDDINCERHFLSTSPDRVDIPRVHEKVRMENMSGDLEKIECYLESDDLWKKFSNLGTEMIITKSGRRMFPSLRVSFNGVKLNEKYLVAMDIVPTDNKRYRYAYHRSSWLVAGKADPPVPSRIFLHPDGPFTGDSLQKQIISFEKLKLTNNESDKCGHIVLNSMHKYQPRVHIIRKPDEKNIVYSNNKSNNNLSSIRLQLSEDLEKLEYKTFIFPETEFIAVTAYQNQLITKLKIDSNPFAKGFRDSSRLSDFERESMEQLIKDNSTGNSCQNVSSSSYNNTNECLTVNKDLGIINESLYASQLKSIGDITMVSTMIAAAIAANKQHNNSLNTNMVDNAASLRYNSLYNQQLYTESLAKIINFYKPTELIRPNSTNGNANSLMYSMNQNVRFHPYLKLNNNLSANPVSHFSIDLPYSQNNVQNNQSLQNISSTNKINPGNLGRLCDSPSSNNSSNKKSTLLR